MVPYDYVRSLRRKKGKKSLLPKLKISKVKLASFIAVLVLFMVIFGFLASIGLFAWYAKDLPQPDKIADFKGLSTIIYARDGEPLYDIYAEQNLVPVKLEEVPKHLLDATIAIEDKDFFTHKGFSLRGMLRAAIKTVFFGKLEGGSTLTQQLVKNVLLSSERTLPRKIKELMLSLQIERKHSKREILEMYLNNVPYGGTAWGVETAAETYFDKDVSELSLVESAILAGLPQAPTSYSPFGPNPTAYIDRTKDVLRRMREDGYITREEEKDATTKLEKIVFSDTGSAFKAPHFVMYVRKQLVDQFGETMVEKGGLRVTTTLDLALQEAAEKIVLEEVEEVEHLKVSNGAAVVIDPKNGEILAMVGSKDYSADEKEEGFQGKFNVAVQGLRQPGSAIKPITYVTAFDKGYTPATLLVDAPTEFPGGEGRPPYKPVNYDGKYRGPLQLRYGLGNSINVMAVKLLALVGVEDMLSNAYDMGLATLEPTKENVRRFGLSITLGGGEVRLINLTSAFGVFATGGRYSQPVAILKVETVDGKKLFEHRPTSGEKVLDENTSFLISDILADNDARLEVFGPRSYLNLPNRKVAVKTGTTDDLRDNWTIGYTQDVAVGVWVGNNDNSPMNPALASGVTGAAPIWNRLMREALKGRSDGFLAKPDDIISVQVDKYSGGLPVPDKPTRVEYFISGTEPQDISPIYQQLKISKADSSKLANPVEIANGDYEEKDFIVLREEDPLAAVGGPNKWQEGIDAWLQSIEDPLYHPPTEVNTGSQDQVAIEIKEPANEKQYDENKIEVAAKATAFSEIVKMELFVNGELKETVHSNGLKTEFELEKGTYTLKIWAQDARANVGEREVKIGVQVPWNYSEPEPTPEPTTVPTLTPTLSPTPSLTPTPAPSST